jgi:hypothetical protein
VLSYPRAALNFGVAAQSVDTRSLDDSYDKIEWEHDASGSGQFSSKRAKFTFGLRMMFSRKLSCWWEYYHGDEPDEDNVTVKTVSFALLYTFEPAPDRVLLSLGAGWARQRLEATRYYTARETGDLISARFNTGWRNAVPLIVLLELRDKRRQLSPALYLSVRKIAAKDVSWTYRPTAAGKIESKVNLSSFIFSGGLTLVF